MKNPKIIYHISWVFALVSLVCIGFSSWNITNQIAGQSLTGSIKADNVINSSDYMYFDTNNPMSCSLHCDEGFVTDKYTISNYGIVRANYIIDVANCEETFSGDGDSLKVECTLTIKDNDGNSVNVFSNENIVCALYGEIDTIDFGSNVTVKNEAVSFSQSRGTYIFVLKDMWEASTNFAEISVVFYLWVPTGNNFEKFLTAVGGNPNFSVSTRICGVNYEE